jgi:hypothetical protein
MNLRYTAHRDNRPESSMPRGAFVYDQTRNEIFCEVPWHPWAGQNGSLARAQDIAALFNAAETQ